MKLFNKVWLISLFLAAPALLHAEQVAVNTLPGSKQPMETSWLAAWQDSEGAETPFINRLALSHSAYLKQHANNPIDWYPWSQAAFSKAEAQNKLIFLSIGYASCHWCHVMESESFMDVDVATELNQSMVSVKVDREQQPDIDAWYSMAVEAINGVSGWPVTMVLLPDQTPVFAANYLTKDQLITAISRLEHVWQTQPNALKQSGQMLLGEIKSRQQMNADATLPRDTWIETAQRELLTNIDTVNGGFGNDRKFPDEIKLQFLLNQYKTSNDPALRDQLLFQLDSMMNKGLSDVVFGGVFRYTTDPRMSRPHFEKMLYNQALMVALFSDAANWLQQPAYQRYADSIVSFVDNNMRMNDGLYAAAIDADHNGVEGGYYLWPSSALQDVPPTFSRENFENDQFFFFGPQPEATTDWLASLKAKKADEPNKIDHSITAWNALWVTALLQSQHPDEAIGLANAVWDNNWSDQQLFRMKGEPGFLDDYSYLSNAFWQLYMKTGDDNWKSKARLLDARILDLFYEDGQLSYRAYHHGQRFEVDSYQDKELPGALAIAMDSFQHHLTEPRFSEAIEQINTGAAEVIGSHPEFYLSMIQVGQNQYAESEKTIAKGHGRIALRRTNQTGQWQIKIDLDKDWHVNASKVLDERLIATLVLPDNNITGVTYPEGHLLSTQFSSEPLNVYSETVSILIDTENALQKLKLQIRLQACSNEVCLLPENIALIAW